MIAGMNHRTSIAKALRDRISSEMDGSKSDYYYTNLYDNVSTRVYKFEEIREFPFIGISIGDETYNYMPSAQQEVYLELIVLAYVKEVSDIHEELENLISDIKTIVDTGGNLEYTVSTPDGTTLNSRTIDQQISSVGTDQGLAYPFGVASISVMIRYAPPRLALRR